MTQAPTPGPLTASDVRLLVKGDLLRIDTDGALYRFLRTKTSPSSLVIAEPIDGGLEGYHDRCRFAFIGRPGAYGWMPWSGGENPVDYRQQVEIKYRGGRIVRCAAGTQDWTWISETGNDENDIIALRLASTAPVEASGSEREAVAGALGKRRGHPEPWPTDYHDADDVLAALKDLRPQPSGETREAVARVEAFLDSVRGLIRQEGHTLDPADLRALLSARPLALGGQHSSGEGEAYTVTASGSLASFSGADVVTTPARAEALDEGAAGEPFMFAYENVDKPGEWQAFRHRIARADGSICPGRPLYAHPSPTPAADAPVAETAGEAWGYVSRRIRIDGESCEGPWTSGKIGDGFYMLTVDDPNWETITLYAAPVPAQDDDKLREERDLLARQLSSLTSPDIDHKGAKARLMTMRRAALKSEGK